MSQYVQKIEVLEPADSQDLTTLQTVKYYLNITTDLDDVRLQASITYASLVIASICDRSFGLAKVTETVFVYGADPGGLNLFNYPLREIESITQGDALLGSDQYEVYDFLGGILHGSFIGKNVVTYKAGYDLPEEAPGALQQACMEVIRSSYYLGGRDPSVQSITDNATGSIRFFPPPGMSRTGASGGGKSGPLPPTTSALIMPYRRLALA